MAPRLKHLLAPLDRLLDSAPPWVGQACAVGLFLVAALWVAMLSKDYIYRGAPDRAWWRDLRIWAWLAMLPYVLLYIFFR